MRVITFDGLYWRRRENSMVNIHTNVRVRRVKTVQRFWFYADGWCSMSNSLQIHPSLFQLKGLCFIELHDTLSGQVGSRKSNSTIFRKLWCQCIMCLSTRKQFKSFSVFTWYWYQQGNTVIVGVSVYDLIINKEAVFKVLVS